MACWGWILPVSLRATPALPRRGCLVLLAGGRTDAPALGGLLPDRIVRFRRLLRDLRVSWWRKAFLARLIGDPAMPIEIPPGFIPATGQLDDARRRHRPAQHPARLR